MAVTAAASVAGVVFAATPATAAVTAGATVSIEYGASYYKGTASWSNRSVAVDASFKATGCRRVYVRAFAGSTSLDFKSTSTWCDRSGPADFALAADVVGGSDNIWVYMTDGNQNYLKGQTCYRAGYCIDGLH
ncbi:DUF3869 domain-containing protein [Streptomyces cinnabarinus]|uniref:DUF3869 domain-containing protein n=1 Tax=Streptomyces cinnabarinus TaxID=67287 RepID=A0ABY7KTE9_9ACTN|nr:DUF3869 domain-containing protein [Streptomyces cinnabarinus]WAZ26682.1 DUF3869 domain-containing protein [Streptomyces cinnabarinus]